MNCTSCKSGKLSPAHLDDLFPCHTCSNCGGNLILLNDYLRWMEKNTNLEFVSATDVAVEAEETQSAMICPKTSTLMLKYRISKDSDHRLDLSPSINAIWLDKGEWGLLKSKGLAGKLNEIFTDTWQRKIREARAADTMSALYEREFGEYYEQIKEFRSLLETMSNKSNVIAFLVSDDPFKV